VLILYLVQGALGVAALVVMQAEIIPGYAVGLFVFVAAVVAAYRLEQVDLTHTNPAPPGAPQPVPLKHRIARRIGRGQIVSTVASEPDVETPQEVGTPSGRT
jgi:hypothetical protein